MTSKIRSYNYNDKTTLDVNNAIYIFIQNTGPNPIRVNSGFVIPPNFNLPIWCNDYPYTGVIPIERTVAGDLDYSVLIVEV